MIASNRLARRGQQPRIEDYLVEVEQSEQDELLRELLACEWELRLKSSHPANEGEFCRRFRSPSMS
ncbi:MAG: hypothetical protein R3C99_12695 [Pirellulaceae bacterium]